VNALPAPYPLGRPWLLADIGGTHARFGWLGTGTTSVTEVRTLKTAEHAGPVAAARAYLSDLAARLGPHYSPPRAAAFAVATAVGGDAVALTNAGWTFSCQASARELGVERLLVLNDFEALALSLPRLAPSQLRAIGHAAHAAPAGALAVIGPGTGLGVAGLAPAERGRWVAVPGEGGHASLPAADDYECALLAAVRRDYPHVSAERLLSGIGLPVLYAGVARLEGAPVAATPGPVRSSEIVARGLDGSDAIASRTLDLFCALLGGFAGNVALTLGARGGVYIGGGIVPRLGERFFQSQFRARFEAKGRFAPYLQGIPTWLITDTLAALDGAACALEQSDA
jgi:glucokinase